MNKNKTQSFRLPLPPPVNQTYAAVYSSRLKRTVFFMKYPAKKWKKLAETKISDNFTFMEGKINMSVDWYLKRDRDIDSGLKIIMDVFQGVVFKNDSQINSLQVTKQKTEEEEGFAIVTLD
jgi:Holliday junction resolvase RusA-like endonuclease